MQQASVSSGLRDSNLHVTISDFSRQDRMACRCLHLHNPPSSDHIDVLSIFATLRSSSSNSVSCFGSEIFGRLLREPFCVAYLPLDLSCLRSVDFNQHLLQRPLLDFYEALLLRIYQQPLQRLPSVLVSFLQKILSVVSTTPEPIWWTNSVRLSCNARQSDCSLWIHLLISLFGQRLYLF